MSSEPGNAPPGQPQPPLSHPPCLEKQPVLMAITWEHGPGSQGAGGREQQQYHPLPPLKMMPGGIRTQGYPCMNFLGEIYW